MRFFSNLHGAEFKMSVNGLKPTFTDINGYKEWRKQFNNVYQELARRIRQQKKALRTAQQRYSNTAVAAGPIARVHNQVVAHSANHTAMMREMEKRKSMTVNAYKLCTLLDEAKKRMAGITQMKKDMNTHLAQFPIRIEECDRVDFHFNKKHLEYSWIPMWVLKTKGKTFYVHHVNALCPWTTRETPENDATKGSIRLRNCSLEIDAEGVATLKAIEEMPA
jgi:hypothetical protein